MRAVFLFADVVFSECSFLKLTNLFFRLILGIVGEH